jgi:hypothetical protein
MLVLKTRLLLIAMIVLVLALTAIVLLVRPFILQPQAMRVDQLWHSKRNLEGQIVAVRGVPVFDPHADYGSSLFLVDDQTSAADREPKYAVWFGIGIADLKCEDKGTTTICRPFDPSQADVFVFKGTLHLIPAGMFPVMELSDIDFEQSRQLINGEWLPISLGEFEIPSD